MIACFDEGKIQRRLPDEGLAIAFFAHTILTVSVVAEREARDADALEMLTIVQTIREFNESTASCFASPNER